MILSVALWMSVQTKQVFVSDLDTQIQKTLPLKEEEKWLSVPWRTHLIKSREEAQRAGKPIYLWIMVGNPQGCT